MTIFHAFFNMNMIIEFRILLLVVTIILRSSDYRCILRNSQSPFTPSRHLLQDAHVCTSEKRGVMWIPGPVPPTSAHVCTSEKKESGVDTRSCPPLDRIATLSIYYPSRPSWLLGGTLRLFERIEFLIDTSQKIYMSMCVFDSSWF